MKEKGFSYNTINNHKRSLKASFYIAIQDDYVRKNPFDFKLSEVIENDTKEKVALTEEEEQALPVSYTHLDCSHENQTGNHIVNHCGN